MGFTLDFLPGLGDITDNSFMEEDRNQRQQFDASQNYLSQQRQFDFQREMSNTAYQRAVADMRAAGVNPMLAAHVGGASTPSGGSSSVSSAGGSFRPSGRTSGSNWIASAAELQLLDAQTEKVRAETEETRARTPTYAVSMDKMKQDISESVERTQRAIAETARAIAETGRAVQETGTSAASELKIREETRNLTVVYEQIKATISNLRSQTRLTTAQTGLTEQETARVRQQVQANLPRLEAILKDMERSITEMSLPDHRNRQAAADSFVGQMKEYLRGLIPLQGIFGSVPIGRGGSAPKYKPNPAYQNPPR